MKARIAIAASVLTLALASSGAPRAQESKPVTITGAVRDPACLAMHKMSGEKHRACAIACAKKGTPLGIQGDDGNYYVAVAPGHPTGGANDLLSKYAEQKVKVTGNAGEAKGLHVIEVEKVEPAS